MQRAVQLKREAAQHQQLPGKFLLTSLMSDQRNYPEHIGEILLQLTQEAAAVYPDLRSVLTTDY